MCFTYLYHVYVDLTATRYIMYERVIHTDTLIQNVCDSGYLYIFRYFVVDIYILVGSV